MYTSLSLRDFRNTGHCSKLYSTGPQGWRTLVEESAVRNIGLLMVPVAVIPTNLSKTKHNK